MYSRFQLAQKYLYYRLTASNGKGHGIHSPFVFDFVENVLNDTRDFPAYSRIELLRQQLEKDPAILEIEDLGAGSALNGTRHRSIAELARHAAKPKKLGQLLFRLAYYYRPRTILELGTSLGLSTAYLTLGAMEASAFKIEGGGAGAAGTVAKVLTIEGAASVAAVADKNFRSLGLENVELITGNFDHTLAAALERMDPVDLAFVDGNHRLEPTLRYFNSLISRSSGSSVLIFDDIHWSREMEEAWEGIKQDTRVFLTIDLFFIGLVFFRDEFKVKQDFIIRF